MKKLLGYVVKLPDGTWSPKTPEPMPLPLLVRRLSTSDTTAGILMPVFAVTGSTWMCDACHGREPEKAAEGRYAVLGHRPRSTFFEADIDRTESMPCASRDLALRAKAELEQDDETRADVVRILADGEFEAAVAGAHEAGRTEAFAAVGRAAMGVSGGDVVLDAVEAAKKGGGQ